MWDPVHQPGIEPVPPVLETWSLNHWTSREVSNICIFSFELRLKGNSLDLKNLPAGQGTRVQSLGQEDPLEKEMATHSSVLAWENSMERGAWCAAVHGVTKSWTQLAN